MKFMNCDLPDIVIKPVVSGTFRKYLLQNSADSSAVNKAKPTKKPVF